MFLALISLVDVVPSTRLPCEWFWIVIPPELVTYEEDAQINPEEITKHNRYASYSIHRHTMKKQDKEDASER